MSKSIVSFEGITVSIEQNETTSTEAVSVMVLALLGAGYMLSSILDSMECVIQDYRDE